MKALEAILEGIKDKNEELYREGREELYELTNGPHFDESKARDAVSHMYSKDTSGEHYTFDDVIESIKPYISQMGERDTAWDAYVALNGWWHDMHGYLDEPTIIQTCMRFYFADEDAPDGKIYKYVHAMR